MPKKTDDLGVLLAKADNEFLRLDVLPTKLPRMIQTRAHTKRRNCERPGVTQRLPVDIDLPNFLDHKSYLGEAVRKPQYLEAKDRPLILELTEDFTVKDGHVVRRGQRMVCGGIHRIAAAWELGWTSIPCRVLKVDATTASRLLIRENSKPYKPARTARDYREKLLMFERQHGRHASINEAAKMLGISRARVSQLRAMYPELRPDRGNEEGLFDTSEKRRVLSRHAATLAKRGLDELREGVTRLAPEEFIERMLGVIIDVVPDPDQLSEIIEQKLEELGIPIRPTE